jgi:hypothetical protein
MSHTSIYRLGDDAGCIGETKNAWRSGMYVWNDMASRYFHLSSFPIFDNEMQRKIWNTHNFHNIPDHERIVLTSTMDNAIVHAEDIGKLVEAYEKYGAEHPNSNFREQAAIIRASEIEPDSAIAWQQTSVGEFWGKRWSEDDEDYLYYDHRKGDKHFDVFDFEDDEGIEQ